MRNVGKAKNLQQKIDITQNFDSLTEWLTGLPHSGWSFSYRISQEWEWYCLTLKLKCLVTEWCFLIKQLQNITLWKNCRILCYVIMLHLAHAPQAVQQALPISQCLRPLSPPPFLALCPEPAKSLILLLNSFFLFKGPEVVILHLWTLNKLNMRFPWMI